MTGTGNLDELPSTYSTAINTSSHWRNPATDIGSRSIIAEPGIDYAASQSAFPTHYSPSASVAPSHHMAGLPLPLFDFGQCVNRGSATTSSQPSSDSNDHDSMQMPHSAFDSPQALGNSRPRQPGIRENTDESCDLPKSNDILQHIAEFYRSRGRHTPQESSYLVPSYGATSVTNMPAAEREDPYQTYDNIEAEIDSLKEDVLKLRQEADKSRTTPKTKQDHAIDNLLSMRNKTSGTEFAVPIQESAAARLQRMHEAQSESTAQRPFETISPVLPGQMDFPALGQPSALPTTPSRGNAFSCRRPSYAHVASSSMVDAINHTLATAQESSTDKKALPSTLKGPKTSPSVVDSSDMLRTITTSTEVTQCTHESNDDEGTVIILQRQDIPARSLAKQSYPNTALDVSPSGKAKNVPHFAQPTKSFARRAGETLRKESTTSVSLRSPRESSPPKHGKENEVTCSTAKHLAHQQSKRKSLPGEWRDVSYQPSELKSRQTPTMNPVAKKSIKGKESQTTSPQRQKNAYMATTASATKRTKMTPYSYKTQLEQTRKAKDVPVENVPPIVKSPAVPRPNTSLSEASSVCFTTDQPSGFITDCAALSNRKAAQGYPLMIQTNPTYYQDSESQLTPALAELAAMKAVPQVIDQHTSYVSPWRSQTRSRYELIASDSPGAIFRVQNTTAKRRTSHSYILAPILARLQSQGLLKQNNDGHDTPGDTCSTGAAMPHPGTNGFPTSPKRFSETQSDDSSVKSGTTAWKVLPPHLRRLLNVSSTIPFAGVTGYQEGMQSHFNPQGFPHHDQSITKERHDSVINKTVVSFTQGLGSSSRMPGVPTLRATAEVFEPKKTHSEALSMNESGLPIDYLPNEVWCQLIPKLKSKIANHRAAQNGRPRYPIRNSRMARFGTSPTCDNFFNNEEKNSPPVYQQLWPLASQVSTNSSVKACQTLTPSLSAGRKTVHWMLKDNDGKKTAANFGRAPPLPSLTILHGPSTPSMSSISSTSSPPKTPSTAQGWRIGSTYATRPYGWKGGDGKEISFVGYGPHAERDPNSVVGFDFRGTMANYSAGFSNGFGDEGKNDVPVPFVAPRSQRQWAERLGYTKVPCGDVEITHAVEQMPFGSQLAGYCYDCAGR